MNKITLAVALFVLSASASARMCQTYGNMTYCDDGTSYQTYGNITYGSDGSTTQRYGNTSYTTAPDTPKEYIDRSSGTKYRQSSPGSMMYRGTDGSLCMKIGNELDCR